jgi:hypothetical protein
VDVSAVGRFVEGFSFDLLMRVTVCKDEPQSVGLARTDCSPSHLLVMLICINRADYTRIFAADPDAFRAVVAGQ